MSVTNNTKNINRFAALDQPIESVTPEVLDISTPTSQVNHFYNDDEFPLLGSAPAGPSSSIQEEKNTPLVDDLPPFMATSYHDDREQQSRTEMIRRLKGTRVCRNAPDCWRQRDGKCNFAHTPEEFVLPRCMFRNCNRRDVCQYMHDDETEDEFYQRTGRDRPVFPTEKATPPPLGSGAGYTGTGRRNRFSAPPKRVELRINTAIARPAIARQTSSPARSPMTPRTVSSEPHTPPGAPIKPSSTRSRTAAWSDRVSRSSPIKKLSPVLQSIPVQWQESVVTPKTRELLSFLRFATQARPTLQDTFPDDEQLNRRIVSLWQALDLSM